MCCANLRNVIWRLFEDPNSSKAARVILIVGAQNIQYSNTSGIGYCQLLISFHLNNNADFVHLARIPGKIRNLKKLKVFQHWTLKEVTEAGVEEENYFFRSTEAIFVGWFTLEFLIRFVVSPSKVEIFSFRESLYTFYINLKLKIWKYFRVFSLASCCRSWILLTCWEFYHFLFPSPSASSRPNIL